jgi:predicted nucleic acid-binding protein
MSALADTSLFIASEQRRPLGSLPGELCVCVVTIAEFALGVVQADRG